MAADFEDDFCFRLEVFLVFFAGLEDFLAVDFEDDFCFRLEVFLVFLAGLEDFLAVDFDDFDVFFGAAISSSSARS